LLNVKAYRLAKVISDLKTEFTSRRDIESFIEAMKSENLNLLREIGERMKAEVAQDDIVDEVKDKIVDTIDKVLRKVANQTTEVKY